MSISIGYLFIFHLLKRFLPNKEQTTRRYWVGMTRQLETERFTISETRSTVLDSPELYTTIFAVMPTAVALIHITAAAYEIIDLNQACGSLLESEPKHLLGRDFAQLPMFVNNAVVVAALQQLQYAERLDNVNLQVRQQGNIRDMKLSATTFEHACSRQAVLVLSDCTDAKQTEAQLQAALHGADAANRAKSAFLANMSHEIRTPLNAICGFAAMLARAPQAEHNRELAEIIVSAGRDLTSLLNAVLMQSKLESEQFELEYQPFALTSILDAVGTEVCWRLGDKPVKFACTVASDVGDWFHGDVGCLRQILTALVNNAVKFTAAGSITLHVRRQACSASPNMLDFIVTDTGVGIAASQMHRVF